MAKWRKVRERCSGHLSVAPTGHVAWHEWAERQGKKGEVQRYCAACDRFFFLCEWGTPGVKWEDAPKDRP